jgi:hypothetical protein
MQYPLVHISHISWFLSRQFMLNCHEYFAFDSIIHKNIYFRYTEQKVMCVPCLLLDFPTPMCCNGLNKNWEKVVDLRQHRDRAMKADPIPCIMQDRILACSGSDVSSVLMGSSPLSQPEIEISEWKMRDGHGKKEDFPLISLLLLYRPMYIAYLYNAGGNDFVPLPVWIRNKTFRTLA